MGGVFGVDLWVPAPPRDGPTIDPTFGSESRIVFKMVDLRFVDPFLDPRTVRFDPEVGSTKIGSSPPPGEPQLPRYPRTRVRALDRRHPGPQSWIHPPRVGARCPRPTPHIFKSRPRESSMLGGQNGPLLPRNPLGKVGGRGGGYPARAGPTTQLTVCGTRAGMAVHVWGSGLFWISFAGLAKWTCGLLHGVCPRCRTELGRTCKLIELAGDRSMHRVAPSFLLANVVRRPPGAFCF